MDTNVGGIVLALTYERWTWMASSLGVFSPKLSYTSYVSLPGWRRVRKNRSLAFTTAVATVTTSTPMSTTSTL